MHKGSSRSSKVVDLIESVYATFN